MNLFKMKNKIKYIISTSLIIGLLLTGCNTKPTENIEDTTLKPTANATSLPTSAPTDKPTENITEATEVETAPEVIQGTTVSTMAIEISTERLSNPATEAPTSLAPTEQPTEQPTEKATNIQELFERLLKKSGCPINRIEEANAQQLIFVDAYGTEATVYMFEKNNDNKWIDMELKCSGYVGSSGVDLKQMEGDKVTPIGLYSIGEAFYIDTQPSTWLNSFKITDNTYWVDDPDSAFYNKKVEGVQNKDWNSAEHMIDYYNSYKYGCVINYNTNPIVKGKGSAIFMHCGNSSTSGCIAVSEQHMLRYLEILNTAKNPHILIF